MHLVPPERAHRRVIDDHRVCEAIAGAGDGRDVRAWAVRFAMLSDPGRLTLLLCIHAAGPICVSDLAVAADMNDTAVSQSLRLLRSQGIVTAHRDGRVIRYELADATVHDLLHLVRPATTADPAH
ncbi:MAG: transcriptional regulator [Actinomycetia bacterium]|jgi:ArsR family transcriptional regulator, lead/cadmium/zinc/bismuth-responsive transcriptional repressor|nr:transcriptional regulator [Actinomycetes bacterium]